MSNLAGKHALITGASSGIGLAIARSLAASGMNLHLIARDREKLERARALVQDTVPEAQVSIQSLDFSQAERELEAQLATIETQSLAVVVHSAGAYSSERIMDTSAQDLEAMFRINVSSALVLAQTFAKPLQENSGQFVVINSSVAQKSPKAAPGAYAATKHAARALTDSLRDTFNPLGVRVLSIFPGRTATPMQEAIFASEDRDYPAAKLLQSEDVAAVVQNALELPPTAEVTDISVRPMQKT